MKDLKGEGSSNQTIAMARMSSPSVKVLESAFFVTSVAKHVSIGAKAVHGVAEKVNRM